MLTDPPTGLSAAPLVCGCLTCKPGYAPDFTVATLDPFYNAKNAATPGVGGITTCKQSTYCATGNLMVNGCSTCQATNTLTSTYYAFVNQFFSSCTAVNSDNCFMASAADLTKCGVCKVGYFLNYDSVCESLSIPNCST